jgi:hypothetical protein
MLLLGPCTMVVYMDTILARSLMGVDFGITYALNKVSLCLLLFIKVILLIIPLKIISKSLITE